MTVITGSASSWPASWPPSWRSGTCSHGITWPPPTRGSRPSGCRLDRAQRPRRGDAMALRRCARWRGVGRIGTVTPVWRGGRAAHGHDGCLRSTPIEHEPPRRLRAPASLETACRFGGRPGSYELAPDGGRHSLVTITEDGAGPESRRSASCRASCSATAGRSEAYLTRARPPVRRGRGRLVKDRGMGLEAECDVRFGGQYVGRASAQLEEKEIVFRGAFRLKVPLGALNDGGRARGGALHARLARGHARLELGDAGGEVGREDPATRVASSTSSGSSRACASPSSGSTTRASAAELARARRGRLGRQGRARSPTSCSSRMSAVGRPAAARSAARGDQAGRRHLGHLAEGQQGVPRGRRARAPARRPASWT